MSRLSFGLFSSGLVLPDIALVTAWTEIERGGSYEAGGEFTAGAGDNRSLLVAIAEESNGRTPTAVDYGGEALTQIVLEDSREGAGLFGTTASLWILDEAGIAAATGSPPTLSATLTSGSGGKDGIIYAAVYENVDQSSAVVDSDGASTFDNSATDADDPATVSADTEDGGLLFGIFVTDEEGAAHSWSGLTEVVEAGMSFTEVSLAANATSAGTANVDASATPTVPTSASVAIASLRKAA